MSEHTIGASGKRNNTFPGLFFSLHEVLSHWPHSPPSNKIIKINKRKLFIIIVNVIMFTCIALILGGMFIGVW